MTQPTDPKDKTCTACPYNRMTADGLHLDCDPPMGECLLEREPTPECRGYSHIPNASPEYTAIYGEGERPIPFDEY